MSIGTKAQLDTQQILSLFAPVEGQVAFYYGRIRNGKTYSATADIIALLLRGEIVYANWNIDFKDFDERNVFGIVFMKWFFGRKLFFKYLHTNFHYFDPDNIDVAFLGRLVNVHIFIDEGQWLFNSHIREQGEEAVEKRKLILHNGHYCRSLNIISQRPVNVFKDMRSQINVWYKCQKMMSFPFLIFSRTTYEDMKDDLPDEENPSSTKVYFADKQILKAYSTHAMRSADAIESVPDYEAFETTRWQRFLLVVSFVVPFGARLRRAPEAQKTKQVSVSWSEDDGVPVRTIRQLSLADVKGRGAL